MNCQRCNHEQPLEQMYAFLSPAIIVCYNCLIELAAIGYQHERSSPIRHAAATIQSMMDRLRHDYKATNTPEERQEAAKRTMTAIRQQLQTIEDDHPGHLAEALRHVTIAAVEPAEPT